MSTTWSTWNNSGSTSATTSGTWQTWVYDSSASSASTTCNNCESSTTTWYTWNTDDYITLDTKNYEAPKNDRAKERRRRNQSKIDAIGKEELKKNAELTAQELLKDLLDDNQLELYNETGRVFVKGRTHDYIIRKHGTTLKRISKDKVQDLCCHLNYKDKLNMPETDNTIAKILAIKYDEERFNELANIHRTYDLKILPKAAKAA